MQILFDCRSGDSIKIFLITFCSDIKSCCSLSNHFQTVFFRRLADEFEERGIGGDICHINSIAAMSFHIGKNGINILFDGHTSMGSIPFCTFFAVEIDINTDGEEARLEIELCIGLVTGNRNHGFVAFRRSRNFQSFDLERAFLLNIVGVNLNFFDQIRINIKRCNCGIFCTLCFQLTIPEYSFIFRLSILGKNPQTASDFCITGGNNRNFDTSGLGDLRKRNRALIEIIICLISRSIKLLFPKKLTERRR